MGGTFGPEAELRRNQLVALPIMVNQLYCDYMIIPSTPASTSLTRLFSRLLKRRDSKPRRNDAGSDGVAVADMEGEKESDIVVSQCIFHI